MRRAPGGLRTSTAGTAAPLGRESRRRQGTPWCRRAACRRPSTVPLDGRGQAGDQAKQRRLAGAVRADQPADAALGQLERAVARVPTWRETACPATAVLTALMPPPRRSQPGSRRSVARSRLSMSLSCSPAPARLRHPALEAAAQRRLLPRRRPVRAAQRERADALPALDQPVAFELAIGLQHRVGVDRERRRRPP